MRYLIALVLIAITVAIYGYYEIIDREHRRISVFLDSDVKSLNRFIDSKGDVVHFAKWDNNCHAFVGLNETDVYFITPMSCDNVGI